MAVYRKPHRLRARHHQRRAFEREARLADVRRHVAVARMEVDGQARLLERRPHGIPVPVAEEGQVLRVRRSRKDDASVAHARRATDLGHGGVDVPIGSQGQRDEAVRRDGDPIHQPVVVGAQDVQLVRRVVERLVDAVADEGEIRIQDGRANAGLVHHLDALRRIESRRIHVLTPGRSRREGLLPPHPGGAPGVREALAADEPRLHLRLLVPANGRNAVAPLLLRHPRRPEIGCLDDVGVGVDDHHATTSLAGDGRSASP